MTKYKCACCGEYTLTEPAGCYEICKNCGWEEDEVQNDLIDFRGVANVISLREAREIYKKSIKENLNPWQEIYKANDYARKHWNQEEEEEERYKKIGYSLNNEDNEDIYFTLCQKMSQNCCKRDNYSK